MFVMFLTFGLEYFGQTSVKKLL